MARGCPQPQRLGDHLAGNHENVTVDQLDLIVLQRREQNPGNVIPLVHLGDSE